MSGLVDVSLYGSRKDMAALDTTSGTLTGLKRWTMITAVSSNMMPALTIRLTNQIFYRPRGLIKRQRSYLPQLRDIKRQRYVYSLGYKIWRKDVRLILDFTSAAKVSFCFLRREPWWYHCEKGRRQTSQYKSIYLI